MAVVYARRRGSEVHTRKGLEARNGQSWAALRRAAAVDRMAGPQGWMVFKIPSTPWAPLIRSIGDRWPRLGASQQLSSSSGTNLLSWARKAADHGASPTTMAP